MSSDTRIQQSRNRPGSTGEARTVPTLSPPVDVFETDDAFHILADLPGVAREDLRIDVDRRTLVIEADRHDGERSYSYRRSFNLPDTVDTGGISAECTNGVLRLTLPLGEHAKPRRIEVRGG